MFRKECVSAVFKGLGKAIKEILVGFSIIAVLFIVFVGIGWLLATYVPAIVGYIALGLFCLTALTLTFAIPIRDELIKAGCIKGELIDG